MSSTCLLTDINLTPKGKMQMLLTVKNDWKSGTRYFINQVNEVQDFKQIPQYEMKSALHIFSLTRQKKIAVKSFSRFNKSSWSRIT